MTDVHNPKTRSYNMSRIKGKDTKPEMLVRRFLFSQGYRYKLHDKTLPGKPDIVLPKYKTIIFIHGCFWHGHKNCKYATIPETRTEWWTAEMKENMKYDRMVALVLKAFDYKIITIWECELKKKRIETTLKKLLLKLPKA